MCLSVCEMVLKAPCAAAQFNLLLSRLLLAELHSARCRIQNRYFLLACCLICEDQGPQKFAVFIMATSHGMLISNNDIPPESLVDMKGDVKIVEHQSNKNPNTSLFVLEKEDHTVANLLRMKLHQNSLVKQCGYRVPHPTQHRVEMRVQTASDGSTKEVPTPQAALLSAIRGCMDDLRRFETLLAEGLQSKGIDSRPVPLDM